MIKCLGSSVTWTVDKDRPFDVSFIKDDLKLGEHDFMHIWLESYLGSILDIANDFHAIRNSSLHDSDKWNCTQVQDVLISKIVKLYSDTVSITHMICSSELTPLKKHRYFILFSYGIVNKIEQLLGIVGRLSELDQKIYLVEQFKPLISEESVTIHALTIIWSGSLKIMNSFQESAHELFKDHLESGDNPEFIESLEFSNTSLQIAKVFLMDLSITSWIQFNRLIKYESLVKSGPFLCSCHTKHYFATLLTATAKQTNQEILLQLLELVLDHQIRPSLMTQSARQMDIVPYQPNYSMFSEQDRAYFIVWHLYALIRFARGDSEKSLISICQPLLTKCTKLALNQFTGVNSSRPDMSSLSPHQEERLSLLLLMINCWCELNGHKQSITIINVVFDHFERNWNSLGKKYFDNSDFRIVGLTVFQLFTKLLNETNPIYGNDGQAACISNRAQGKQEKDLDDTWNRILDKFRPPVAQPVACSSKH